VEDVFCRSVSEGRGSCDIVLLIHASVFCERRIAFNIELSDRAVSESPGHPGFLLTDSKTSLKDMIGSFRVYRVFEDGSTVIAQVKDKECFPLRKCTKSPLAGHRRCGGPMDSRVEGLGDCVGRTRQQIGGKPMNGIWAHPKITQRW